jgi:DNA primase large subunit
MVKQSLSAQRLPLIDMAKYFWSVQAAEYVKDKEVDLAELDNYKYVVSEAESWIDSTLGAGVISPDSKLRPEDTILAYPTARMFITVLGNEYVLRRFATAVSKYAGVLLESEDDAKLVLLATTPGNLGEKPWQLVYQKATQTKRELIAGRIFEWKLFFGDYVSVAQSFHDAYWKLVNRPVSEGWVYLLKPDVTRLMEEAIKIRIGKSSLKPSRELPSANDLPPNLGEALDRISKKVKKRMSELQQYDIESLGAGESAYPGCMKQILDKLNRGIGISHNERLALVFFLSNVGKDIDDILQAFSKVPDFDAARTRYYVEHAMGMRGGGTKYKSFGCPKLQTFGVCSPQDEWCRQGKIGARTLRGPIDFYRARSWVVAKTREEQKTEHTKSEE